MTRTRTDLMAEPAIQLAAPSLKESRSRWWLLVLLFTGMLIGYAHRGAFSVAAPFMVKDLNLSKASTGILLSAFFWVYSFTQIPAGWLVDRFGVRRAYSLGFVLWSMTSTLAGLVNGFAALVGLRVALGAGQGILFPATSRAVANWFQERERGTVTGIYLTGVRFGLALISWLGALLLGRYNWRLFFVITGLVPLIWAFFWTRFLTKWEIAAGSSSPASRTATRKLSFISSLGLLRRRTVLGIFLGFFAYDYAWYVFVTWLPGYLVVERSFTPKEMGLYSAFSYLVMSAIIVGSGFLSDWLVKRGRQEIGVRKTFIMVGLAIGCLVVPAGVVADKMTAMWLLTLSLSGIGVAAPNTWTLTQAVSEQRIVGTVAGIQNFGGNLGGILAPALTGLIAQATDSFALALGLSGAVMLMGIVAYWALIGDRVSSTDSLAA